MAAGLVAYRRERVKEEFFSGTLDRVSHRACGKPWGKGVGSNAEPLCPGCPGGVAHEVCRTGLISKNNALFVSCWPGMVFPFGVACGGDGREGV